MTWIKKFFRIILPGIILASVLAVFNTGCRHEDSPADTNISVVEKPATVPLIDMQVSDRVETATFALG